MNKIVHPESLDRQISRRDLLLSSIAVIAPGIFSPLSQIDSRAGESEARIRFGLVTDVHYADKDSGGKPGSRYYRESLAKLRECVGIMNQTKTAFLCELGDFKDQADFPTEAMTLRYLREIDAVFRAFEGPRYYVFGNHDLDSISKGQFLSVTGGSSNYYSFDAGRIHFIALDACFTLKGEDYERGNFDWRDTCIPQNQISWLANDLSKTGYPTIVFVHQRLDGEGAVFIKNAAEVRKVLEGSGRVLAVFQGHDHPGSYARMGGIHYCTLAALVEGSGAENNAYATVEIRSNGDIVVKGFRRALSQNCPRAV